MVSSTTRPHFTPGKDPIPILQEAGWAPGPVWKGENLVPTGIRSRTVQTVVQSLYRLSYPQPPTYIYGGGGTRWHSWFKHCATSPKFVVSIPDGGLWNFSLTRSCRPHYGPGVDSATNGNEYQKYLLEGKGGRCVGLITLPPSCADRSEILGASTSKGCPGL